MTHSVFDLVFDKTQGGLSRLALINDPTGMNFCREDTLFSLLSYSDSLKCDYLERGDRLNERTLPDLVSFSEEETRAEVRHTFLGIDVTTLYESQGETMEVSVTLRNKNGYPVYFKEGDLSLAVPFNDRYQGSEISQRECCHAHIFTGLNTAGIRAERMGDHPFEIGMVMTGGKWTSYSQVDCHNGDRGKLYLNLAPFHLQSGETCSFSYVLFSYAETEEFFRKASRYPAFLRVSSPRGYTFCSGEAPEVTVRAGFPITQAEVCCEKNPIAFTVNGNVLSFILPTQTTGEKTVSFTLNGVESYASFLVVSDYNQRIEKRLSFILAHQQCMDASSCLYGAFLTYDNEDEEMFFDFRFTDHNACRERFGMGILLVKYLQKHKNPFFAERLSLFTDFLLREVVDEETGEVANNVGHDASVKRLYNIPWVSLYFAELYTLTKNERYSAIVVKSVLYYYKGGGTGFYPNGLRFSTLFRAVAQSAYKDRLPELLFWFDQHIETLTKNGTAYPPHEVSYEQTIVTPALTLILDKYAMSRDSFYLKEAEKHLCLLEKFDGLAPDFRLNRIPIRYWDDFWFGKIKTYGDTFPHYWASLSGYAYYYYGELTDSPYYREIGLQNIKNCLANQTEEGRGTAAYLYAFSSNGHKGKRADPFANDQDFALYFLLSVLE
ncbi:MAG: hypothetical protein MJ078_03010 [Clostridia bacterium]|nr:hypothetical protein [Clostridia bacterium]